MFWRKSGPWPGVTASARSSSLDRGRGEITALKVILIWLFPVGEMDLFHLDVEEETNTLLRFDVVNMDHALRPALLDTIRKEGQVLYEAI